MTPPELLAYLDALDIETHTVDHDAVFTVDEAKRLRGSVPGGHTKALFLLSRDGRLWIVVTLADRRPNLRRLADALGGGRLSFGSPERLTRHLGVVPGAVTPFAVVNDPDQQVHVVIDRQLLALEQLNFHPLTNTKTTAVAPDGLLRFLQSVEHPPTVTDIEYS